MGPPPISSFSDFCHGTSLHGWPHIPGGSILEKIFWVATIIATAVVAVFLCSSTVKQFKTSTVATNLISSTEPISSALFPKVVICNKYRLRQSFMDILITSLRDY